MFFGISPRKTVYHTHKMLNSSHPPPIYRYSQMCRGAGKAANAFGAALQVDLARTGATESTQHPAARVAHDDDNDDGNGSQDVEGAGIRSGEEADAIRREEVAAGSGAASGESMRAELLALQLIECANEMEDHLRAQVPP